MNERSGYGEVAAKRIIERAAQIDAEQGRQLDAPALRQIAAEAGISPAAVDRALEEHESSAATRVPWLKRHRTLITAATMVAAMLLLFFVMRMAAPAP
jgi:DNA-binding transcriptional regulator YhcF (GntR family)